MACRYGFIRTLTGLSNTTLSPAAKLAQRSAGTISNFWVENRKCSGSNHQIAKPRRPDRVKVSSFDVLATSGPRKSFGKRLSGTKVGHDDPNFRIFDGFQEILVLTPVMGLAISGIIINTQVMFLNAWVISLEVNF